MKKNRISVAGIALFACLAAIPAFAEDGFDFGDGAETADSAGSAASALATPTATISGTVKLDVRSLLNRDGYDVADFPVSATPGAKLGVTFANSATEVDLKLDFSEDAIKNNQTDVIDEATARVYLGNLILEGGKMKVVWGKGDKLHVIDNFNANDFTDFIYPDYIDRRIAEPIVRLVFNSKSGSWRSEAIYAPIMTADRFDTTGVWKPASYESLSTLVTGVESSKVAKALTVKDAASPGSAAYYAALANYLTALDEATSFSSSDLYPDTQTLEYGQYGLRFTGTLGSFDWGASYYYGHYKQPSVDMAGYLASAKANAGTSYVNPTLAYDRLQTYGLEGAKAIGLLNMRIEAGYNLTDDFDGDDPAVRNNSVAWVAGFDIDLPLHNLNVNAQETGTWILHGGKIEDNGDYDVNADANDCYTNDKVVVKLSDTFLHEKLALEVSGLWGIERSDLVLMPKATYTVGTGMDVSLGGMCVLCVDSDSEFYAYRKNTFVQLGVNYRF